MTQFTNISKNDAVAPHIRGLRKKIMDALDKGEILTPARTYQLFGTQKLASRISELIDMGYPVIKKEVKNEAGVTVMSYQKGPGAYTLRPLPKKKKTYSSYFIIKRQAVDKSYYKIVKIVKSEEDGINLLKSDPACIGCELVAFKG